MDMLKFRKPRESATPRHYTPQHYTPEHYCISCKFDIHRRSCRWAENAERCIGASRCYLPNLYSKAACEKAKKLAKYPQDPTSESEWPSTVAKEVEKHRNDCWGFGCFHTSAAEEWFGWSGLCLGNCKELSDVVPTEEDCWAYSYRWHLSKYAGRSKDFDVKPIVLRIIEGKLGYGQEIEKLMVQEMGNKVIEVEVEGDDAIQAEADNLKQTCHRSHIKVAPYQSYSDKREMLNKLHEVGVNTMVSRGEVEEDEILCEETCAIL